MKNEEKTLGTGRFFKMVVTDPGGDKLDQVIDANGFNKMEIIGMLERAKYHLITDKE